MFRHYCHNVVSEGYSLQSSLLRVPLNLKEPRELHIKLLKQQEP